MKKVNTILALLLTIFLLVGCNTTPSNESNSDTAAETEVVLRRGYYNPHGTKSFSRVAVALVEEKIVAVNIEEYQFGDAAGEHTFVPNSDAGFGEGYAEGKAMYSKRVNDDLYSKNMADKAQATKKLSENYKAIEDYAKGKTVAELEELLKGEKAGELVDAVSASTLVDTYGYLSAIVDAAKNESMQSTGKATGNVEDIKLGFVQHAAHGDKSFADTVVAMLGDKIVAANIDEFQFMGDGTTVVPNGDGDFGANFAEGKFLGSKRVNDETYSKNMADKAQATKKLSENYKAIEDHVVGLTVAEVEKLVSENTAGEVVDAISSSTLVDTVGYLESIALAAKNVK